MQAAKCWRKSKAPLNFSQGKTCRIAFSVTTLQTSIMFKNEWRSRIYGERKPNLNFIPCCLWLNKKLLINFIYRQNVSLWNWF